MTGAFQILSVVETPIRSGRKPWYGPDDRPVVGRKFDIRGYRRGEPVSQAWFTRDPLKASLCLEAMKAARPVQVTTESCWWGEEMTGVALGVETLPPVSK